MVASAGRNFLLKLGTGSPLTYASIGAIRANSISIDGTEVDVTTMDDAGVRKLLATAGVRSASISASGVFTDSAGQGALTTAVLSGAFVNLKLEDTVLNTVSYTGSFQVTNFEHSGEEGAEQTFSATFASAGAVTYATA
jgi:TP901-1 family phage major tail protein